MNLTRDMFKDDLDMNSKTDAPSHALEDAITQNCVGKIANMSASPETKIVRNIQKNPNQ